MKLEQIVQLIESVSNSNLSSFNYEQDGVSLTLEVKNPQIVKMMESSSIQENELVSDVTLQEKGQEVCNAEGELISSPIVGTFYVAKEEGAEPFVSVGSKVTKGQTIGIIEAMKLMNEVESTLDGVVTEILVEDGMLVEYGQPLVRVKGCN